MLTPEMIRSIAPRARQDYVDALVGGGEVFAKFEINTPMRLAQFMATILHETGSLTIVREAGNYTAKRIRQVWPTRPEAVKFAGNVKGLFNAVYGGRMGNERDGTSDDDGWRYRGGGLIQLTGRDSYERAGKAIGVPLGEHPELIEDAKVSLAAACWEFSKFLKYADKGEGGYRAVCNGINRGNPLSSLAPIGWEDRLHWFRKCTACLCETPLPADDIFEVGDSGAIVKALQERLCALGYAAGKIDGVYGSRTRAATLAFQAENGLETDGRIGPATRAALNSDAAKPMPLGDRATASKEEIKAGDPTLQKTGAVITAVKAVGTTATTVAVADQTGLLDGGASLLSDLKQYQGVASGMAEIVTWSLGHWYYFLPLGCYLIYRWAKSVEGQAVLKYRLGLDLSAR